MMFLIIHAKWKHTKLMGSLVNCLYIARERLALMALATKIYPNPYVMLGNQLLRV